MVVPLSTPQNANTPGVANDVLLAYFALRATVEGTNGGTTFTPIELINCVIDRRDVGQYAIGLSVQAPLARPKNIHVEAYDREGDNQEAGTDHYWTHIIRQSADGKVYWLTIFLNTIGVGGEVTAEPADPAAFTVCNSSWSERSGEPALEGLAP